METEQFAVVQCMSCGQYVDIPAEYITPENADAWSEYVCDTCFTEMEDEYSYSDYCLDDEDEDDELPY